VKRLRQVASIAWPTVHQPPRRTISLSIPAALHKWLVELAQAERRPLNNFLLYIREQYVRRRDEPDDPPPS
jgi:hypothetical protein